MEEDRKIKWIYIWVLLANKQNVNDSSRDPIYIIFL